MPELLPLCLTPGLGWRVNQPPLAVLAFMGFEWEVLHPVRVGDTIHSRSRTAVKRSMREGGVIIEERQVINQHGEVVQKGRFTFLVAKRPPRLTAPADSAAADRWSVLTSSALRSRTASLSEGLAAPDRFRI